MGTTFGGVGTGEADVRDGRTGAAAGGVDVYEGETGAGVAAVRLTGGTTGAGIGVAPFFINISMLCEYAWAK